MKILITRKVIRSIIQVRLSILKKLKGMSEVLKTCPEACPSFSSLCPPNSDVSRLENEIHECSENNGNMKMVVKA